MAAQSPMTPRLRIQLGPAIAIGPGKAQLLEAIAATGSISAAARAMGMSYRRAWLLVDTMNQCFKAPLVATATGGKRGGGAQITPLGVEVLERYQRMQHIASEAVAEEMEAFASLFSDSFPPA
ncbi:winged helix-turn-helix domain-containing protein [Halomonas sp. A29]|uniref:winged helix-turn-helix domain-containing protein n=1 Tax=Halomonas sp. A29 TaxID=3102786 RepID=UPI00398AEE50